jgi:hypothetical protein
MAPGHVRILMCTLNGAAFLPAQLQSFLDQDHGDWSLWISDDGSTDGTRDLLAGFAAAHPGRVARVLDGPRQGSAANFLTLAAHPDLGPGPIALADQDDVWLPHRLGRGLAVLGQGAGPTVYASRTILTDAALRPIRASARHTRPAGFRNALVQNILAGNTLMLDAPALALLRASLPAALAGTDQGGGVPHHDWWVYLLMTGAGARLVQDDAPGVLYRQHDGNLVGAHRGWRGGWDRAVFALRGGYADWIGRNLAALTAADALLTPQARALVAELAALRGKRGLGALAALRRCGVYRQGRAGQAMIAALVLAGRF